MAARPAKLIACIALVVIWLLAGHWHLMAAQPPAPKRIVSLVPALTEMLFAVGAGKQVVGVSSFDRFPPDVEALPRVGALLDPNTERILALKPDLVLVYGSQSELQAVFARAGIKTFSYRHGGIPTVLQSIRDIGTAAGHAASAERVAGELRRRLDAIRGRVAGRRRPRTMVVFERQPRTLREVYAVGGVGFLQDMLDLAGGTNVFADVRRESVQPSHERMLERAPEVILEVRAAGLLEPGDLRDEHAAWSTLPSLPAVRRGRIHLLVGEHLVVPGPRLAQGVEAFARALHPTAFTGTAPQ